MGRITLRNKTNWTQEQANEIYALLLESKEEIARVCGMASFEGKSPLQKLARYWNDHPSIRPEELEKVFSDIMDTELESISGRSYSELVEAEKQILQRQCVNVLGREEGLRLSELEEYLKIVDENPMGDRLKEVLAGLPPVDASARTNIGLPIPEDHGQKFEGFFCSQPFEHAQVDPLGELYLCCPQTLPESAGNLSTNDFMEVWNSEKAKLIRKSVLDGSFKYCSESTCGVLQQRRLPRKDEVKNPYHRTIIEHGITHLKKGPDTINMSYDRSCNLACPSCRSDFVILKGQAKKQAEQIHEHITDEGHLKDVRRLIITGSGDPFGSKLYHSFLREFDPKTAPDLRITLSTNGLLLNEKTWSSICHEAVDRVELSVDGASQETYSLNRGGDFKVLVENLHFIGKLRSQGLLKAFELHYVVQKNNFFEMKDFVSLGREVGADVIAFKQLVNWGTFSESEYLNRAVQLPGHALHQVFRRLLSDPFFQAEDIYMHDLSHLIPKKTESLAT